MNPPSIPLFPRRIWARAVGVAVAFAAALAAGCGGGVGEGGTGGGYTQGTVSGLGSVIVNGVRYDDSTAVVTDVDGTPRSAAALGLGMAVEVESGGISTASGRPEATATAIRYTSEMVGPIAAIDAGTGRITVLGQTVQLQVTTAFGAPLSGLGSLAVGQIVELHAEQNTATGVYLATRVDARADADTPAWRVRGLITERDALTRRFSIGNASFDYGAVPPAGVVVGRMARATLAKTAADSTVWTVTALATGQRALPEGREATLAGLVTEIEAQPKFFSVNGQPVNAAGLTLPNGLALGARVEVKGRVTGGALRATEVSVLAGAAAVPTSDIELIGNVTNVDAAAKTFSVRGTAVSYARADLEWRGGTAADLAQGRRVQVHGPLAAGGRAVEARRIDFNN